MWFFLWLVGCLGGSACFVCGFCLIGFCFVCYPGFGTMEGPVPREEKEVERQPLTWFGEEGEGNGKIWRKRDKAACRRFLSLLPLPFCFSTFSASGSWLSCDLMLLISASPLHLFVLLQNPFCQKHASFRPLGLDRWHLGIWKCRKVVAQAGVQA